MASELTSRLFKQNERLRQRTRMRLRAQGTEQNRELKGSRLGSYLLYESTSFSRSLPSEKPQRQPLSKRKESTGLLRVATFGFWPCCQSLKIAGEPTEPPPYLLRFRPRLIPSDIDCGSLFCFQQRLSAPTFLIVDNVLGGFLMKFVRFPAFFFGFFCNAVGTVTLQRVLQIIH